MAVFGESGSLNVKLLVLNPQKTFLRRIASFDVFCIKVATGVFTVSDWKNPKTKKIAETKRCAKTHETLYPIGITFCIAVGIPDE